MGMNTDRQPKLLLELQDVRKRVILAKDDLRSLNFKLEIISDTVDRIIGILNVLNEMGEKNGHRNNSNNNAY